MSSYEHEGRHDHIADEQPFASEHKMLVCQPQLPVAEKPLGFRHAMVTMPFREGGEVESFTGAQGYRDAVVVACVVIQYLPFTGYLVVLYGFDILAYVAHIPLPAMSVEAMGCRT